MKNRTSVSGCLFIGIMATGLCALTGYAAEEPIKIGALLSQTGTVAHAGQDAQKALQLAVDQINAKGGIKGRKVELLVENTNTEPEKAVSRGLKLTEGEKVLAIIGPDNSTTAFAAREQVAEPNKIVTISCTGSSPKLTAGNPRWFFRGATPAQYQTESLAAYLVKQKGLKRIAILTDSGIMDQSDSFKDSLKGLGLEPVTIESFKTGQTNFNGPLLKIKPTNPEAIFFIGYVTEGVSAIKQARDLGIQAQFAGSIGIVYDEFIKIGGKTVEGVLASIGFTVANDAKQVQDFVAAFKKKYPGSEPSHSAGQSYDQINLIFNAIQNSNLTFDDKKIEQDRQMIRDYLEQRVKNYAGVTAPITYSEKDHTAYKSVNVMQIINGKWKVIVPAGAI
jgi:branched-chain amino acid transport system substrate-binding protein